MLTFEELYEPSQLMKLWNQTWKQKMFHIYRKSVQEEVLTMSFLILLGLQKPNFNSYNKNKLS